MGKPEYVMNFMIFVATELREYMAKLGVKTIDELVGRIDLIKPKSGLEGTAAEVDLSNIIRPDFVSEKRLNMIRRINMTLSLKKLWMKRCCLKNLKQRLKRNKKKTCRVSVKNTDRTFGTILGSEITKKYYNTLEDDTFRIICDGSGGQSFGSFIPNGLTLELVGDSNDYFGKGLSGGACGLSA